MDLSYLETKAIYTAQEAISLTTELRLPSGFAPSQIEARLVSQATLYELFLGIPAGEYETGLGPSWLVGVVGNGLADADILPPASIPMYAPNAPRSVIGAYYAWDASSSDVLAEGILSARGPTSMATILGFTNERVTIATATDLPMLGVEAETPAPPATP